MIYLLCGVLGGAVLAAVVAPLFRKDDSLESAIIEETQWDLLLRKKEVILGNIQDLDFEYKCGKLSDEDYNRVRAEMTAEAAAVIQDIDSLEAAQDLDALIRREVSVRRHRPPSQDRVTCPSCGAETPHTNKFCSECGVRLKAK
jgi:hypothetical protein